MKLNENILVVCTLTYIEMYIYCDLSKEANSDLMMMMMLMMMVVYFSGGNRKCACVCVQNLM